MCTSDNTCPASSCEGCSPTKARGAGPSISRRQLLGGLLTGAASAGAAGAVAVSGLEPAMARAAHPKIQGLPYAVNPDYAPFSQKNVLFTHAFFGLTDDEELKRYGKGFMDGYNYGYSEEPGHTQLEKALEGGAWALSNNAVGPSPAAVSSFGLFSWTQRKEKNPHALMDLDFVKDEQYQFESPEAATAAIKRAARLYGASLVGITRRDPRWDYSDFFDPVAAAHGEDPFFGWERFPFEPKTVIVLAFEMDYEGFTAAPTMVASAAAGEGYSKMAKTALQLSSFLKILGYRAVPCGNDTGLSIPYAVAAGLGEDSRAGYLVTYKYGPRVRLAKVYTELDLVAYDSPRPFGVREFCTRCKRCADSCPSEAISRDDQPSFAPTHDNAHRAFYNNPGVEKWYMDARKCLEYWAEIGGDCGSCIAACPYNKPDFWHHSLVDRISAGMPGPVHSVMRQLDEVFGYGNVDDHAAVANFWSARGRSYDGF